MAGSDRLTERHGTRMTSDDIARLVDGADIGEATAGVAIGRTISMRESNRLLRLERVSLHRKVWVCVIVLVVLVFLSLGIMGAAGQYYVYTAAYTDYSPLQVLNVLCEHAYNAIAQLTHQYPEHTNAWLLENVPGYWAIAQRAGVIGVTLVCAVLLSVSGMLYQNVFKNPIAGPGMLGVSSGVSIGMMLLVVLYSGAAMSMIKERYLFCYGFGAAILLFVIVAGRKLSGKDRPFDTVTMLLVGAILGQLIGFVVNYVTLFVMSDEDYATFFTISQMLTIDTSAISWLSLGVASLLSFIPVFLLRYQMNGLAFDDEEARLLGINPGRLRGIALVCGAIMILAAQVHTGMVGLISLIVPYLSRSLFGCEFSKQLVGNTCLGTILLLICRDITDLIPFVGDGLAIGSVVSIVALPLLVLMMAKQMRGWE